MQTMKRKGLLYSVAALMLLVGLCTINIGVGHAGPGPAADDPPTPVPKTTPEPPGGGEDQDDQNKTSVITRIFKVMFDSSTMKDAIVNAMDSIFNEAVGNLTRPSSPFYQMGSEISEIVFETDKLREIRLSSWIQLRKVAFALLPLTAALTIWASMKNGLYSVTGYANTFEAVTEFVVSIGIALASYWLMEQAIGLVKSLTLAINDALRMDITASVFAGMIIKPAIAVQNAPVLTMIMSIFVFVFILAFMGSVLISFLAREVVIIIAVAMAPVMMILGSVRPLAWLRGLWMKAFFIFLLLLPINVLTMGVSAKLLGAAMEMTTGSLAAVFQLVILVGAISVLIAINGTLGKMVYGAALEVAEKVGKTLTSIGSMAVGLTAGIAGAGALGGTALAGTAGSVAPTAGGGLGGGLTVSTVSAGGEVTSTSRLTTSIGSALSTSSNPAVSGFGRGLRVGNSIRDYQMGSASPPPSPKLNVATNGVPGLKAGEADVMGQIDTPQKAHAIGFDPDTLAIRAELGIKTSEATLIGAENEGVSARDVLRAANYLGPGNWDVTQAGRDFIRSEASSFAFHDKGMFKQKDIPALGPVTNALQGLDFIAAQRIVQHDQRITTESPFTQIAPAQIQDVARAVRAQRLSGMANYHDIINDANQSASLSEWLRNIQGRA